MCRSWLERRTSQLQQRGSLNFRHRNSLFAHLTRRDTTIGYAHVSDQLDNVGVFNREATAEGTTGIGTYIFQIVA